MLFSGYVIIFSYILVKVKGMSSCPLFYVMTL